MTTPRIILRRAAFQQRPGRFPSRRAMALAAAAAGGALALGLSLRGPSDAVQPVERTAAQERARAEIIAEDRGRIETLRRARLQALSLLEVQPAAGVAARAKLGEQSMVRFIVPGAKTNGGAGVLTAVLLHGSDEPVPLAVVDKGNGQLEVPFTPRGIGRFDVQLRANGIPVAQNRVGVVGSAAGGHYTDDYLDYTADMRAGRSRPAARGSRRR